MMNDEMKMLLVEFDFNKSNLARFLNVSPQAVKAWYDLGTMPPKQAIKIEELTDGKFKAVNLCKDFH